MVKIATNYINKLLVGDKTILLKDVPVAASLKDEKLAVVYANNSIELIDIDTNKTLFKEYLQLSLANDTRISKSIFYG